MGGVLVLGYPPGEPEPGPPWRMLALIALTCELLVLLNSSNPAAVVAAGSLGWALRALLEWRAR